MRAYRATSSYVSGHIGRNMWVWIGIFSAAMVIGGFLYSQLGRGAGRLGDLTALFGCIAGTLIMLQSQLGYISTHRPPPADDEDDLPVVASVPPTAPQP
jgi:hypothetical protein